jgi:ATP-dependent RNA helicase HelY
MNRERRKEEVNDLFDEKRLNQDREALFQGMGHPPEGTFEADEFQKEAISNVVNSQDTLVVAPTGSGKTYIAVECIQAALNLGLKAVYTTPLKALSNTKYNEFKKRFEPQYSVGLLTGDRKIDTSSDVVIATTEIYRNELYRAGERFSLVILDEVHFIGDPQRGPVWEESIILTPSSSTLLMLSATISNSTEIVEWISEVRSKPCALVSKQNRPVELRYAFMDPRFGIIPLRTPEARLSPRISRFYQGTMLDSDGMKLKGGVFANQERQGAPHRGGREARARQDRSGHAPRRREEKR